MMCTRVEGTKMRANNGGRRCADTAWMSVSAHAVVASSSRILQYRNRLETVSFQRLTRGPSSTCLAVPPSEWLVSAKIAFLRVIGPFFGRHYWDHPNTQQ